MRYNLDEETFEYFSDARNIPHTYLNVVAKKFSIDYNCKSIYKLEIKIDETDDQNDKTDKTDQDDKTDKTDQNDKT